jgi:pimeloyl-ACP methyl ester carboxylesterase
LPSFYCADALIAATHGGMAEVVELPGWQEPLTRHPANRERMLGLDPAAFIATMTQWAEAYFPQPGAPIPCVTPEDLAAITTPVMVLRSGQSDMHHSRATSEAVAGLIPGAQLAEPPWGDREWVERLVGNLKGEAGLFSRWPLLAPMILDFAQR